MDHLYSSPENALLGLDLEIEKMGIKKIWIALSGGIDSMALLHATLASQAKFQGLSIEAIHVNHGLAQESAVWAEWVKNVCRNIYHIPCHLLTLSLPKKTAMGIEGEARKARYEAIGKILPEKSLLLTAHHRRDQIETFFLNLQRGSAISGLAGMPSFGTFFKGWLARPWLEVPKEAIIRYQKEKLFPFIEDPSNQACTFDRNFIRHHILPPLEQRWPYWEKHLSKTIQHCRQLQTILEELGNGFLRSAALSPQYGLNIQALRKLSNLSKTEILRQWLRLHQGYRYTQKQLEELLKQSGAGPNAQVKVSIGDFYVRRYQNVLFAHPNKTVHSFEPFPLPKNEKTPYLLGDPFGTIYWSRTAPIDAPRRWSYPLYLKDPEKFPDEFIFSMRAPDLPIQARSNKNFFQKQQLPPWVRPYLPQPKTSYQRDPNSKPIWIVWQWWHAPFGQTFI